MAKSTFAVGAAKTKGYEAIVRISDIKTKTKKSLLHMAFQTHAFLTIIHPLDFSDFALGDVLDDILLGLVTGIGQGLWCLDFFNFGISHGERNLGHRSRCSAHWRECRACGDSNKEEDEDEGAHVGWWYVIRYYVAS